MAADPVASTPQPFVSPRSTLLVLLLTTAILLLGAGLFGTLLGVRATLEQFPTSLIGLIMSAYFVGFIVGTFVCVRIAHQVGHVRAFAALAAVFTTMALAHAVWVAVLPWVLFRFVSGIAMAGLALIIESWLNAQAEAGSRGSVFATYMVVNLAAVAVGQLLLTASDPLTFVLFAGAAMLIALSLVPTALVRVQAPELHDASGLELRELARLSPVGVGGCLAAGVAGGAFWGMAPVFVTGIGHGQQEVALFMFVAILGGMLSQLPIGRYSDTRDRRRVIVVVAALAAAASALVMLASFAPFGALTLASFFFGVFMFPIYGLSVARAHDLLAREQAVEATRGLLLVFGMGAAAGPFVAGLIMAALGSWSLFGAIAAVFTGLLLYGLRRMREGVPVATEEQRTFVPVLATTQEAIEMAEADVYPEG